MTIWHISAARIPDPMEPKVLKVVYKKYFLGICYSTIEDIYTFD